jgi:hypothetical protein
MKTFSSLKEIERAAAATPSGGGTKKYFSLKDGDSFRIRFRQELTEDSSNYNQELGTAISLNIITSVVNWKWKVASTASSEQHNYRCWATEKAGADKRWRPRPHLLVNIAVEVEPGKWEPRVLDTTFNQRHIGLTLIEYAKEFNTITDRYYKYSRTGSGASDTNYNLIPLEVAEEPESIGELAYHDLESMYIWLPYEEQEMFLTTGERNNAPGDAW